MSGELPRGWTKAALGDVCELVNGRGFKPHEWSRNGYPIIRIQNLNGSPEYNYFNGEFDPKILVTDGQLLFAWSGSKGTSFGPHIWRGPDAVLNYHTWKVVVSSRVEPDFLFQMLKFITVEIERNTHGQASLVHTQKSEMEAFDIVLPPRPEQQRIATVLSACDRAVDTAAQLAASKRRRFEDLRAILFREDGDETSTTFGEFLTESRIPGDDGSTARKLTVKLYGRGVEAKVEKREGSASTRYFIRRSGQLIYSKLDFLNGAFGIIPHQLDGFQSTLDLPAFDIAPSVNPLWLLNYLTRPSYYENQVDLARGQRIARRVNPSDFLASEVALPSRSRQDVVGSLLNETINDISVSEQLTEALRAQKRGLMQKLLTGQWRLDQRFDEVEAAPQALALAGGLR